MMCTEEKIVYAADECNRPAPASVMVDLIAQAIERDGIDVYPVAHTVECMRHTREGDEYGIYHLLWYHNVAGSTKMVRVAF